MKKFVYSYKIERIQASREADTWLKNFRYFGSKPSCQTVGSFLAAIKYFKSSAETEVTGSEAA